MRRFLIVTGLLTPIIFLIIGIVLHRGLPPKPQVSTTDVQPVVVNKDDTEERRAAAEKIAGYNNPDSLISIYDLKGKIYDPGVFVFDTRARSYQVYLANFPRGHIPGALPIFHSDYSHPEHFDRIATPDQLQNFLGACGINNKNTIVLYGNDGLQARLYWAMKMYGYDKVKILDGGIEKWRQCGYDISTAKPVGRLADTFEFDLTKSKSESMMAIINDVKAAIGSAGCIIVDTRSNAAYLDGHVPGSINLAYTELFNDDQTFKQVKDLQALAEGKGITRDKQIIVYSDDGVQSSLGWFALSELLGYPNVKNYDGSFNEWLTQKEKFESGE